MDQKYKNYYESIIIYYKNKQAEEDNNKYNDKIKFYESKLKELEEKINDKN